MKQQQPSLKFLGAADTSGSCRLAGAGQTALRRERIATEDPQ